MTDRPSLIMHWLGGFLHRDPALKKEDAHPSTTKIQSDQMMALSCQLKIEKRRNAQLILLNALSLQLETPLDQPVAAQLAVNTLDHALDCSYVCFLIHEPERREFVALASAGRMAKLIPPGYWQSVAQGMVGRAARLRKTKISNDTRRDPDFLTSTMKIIYHHLLSLLFTFSRKLLESASIDL